MIYLDYQATTPLAPEAREAMLRWLDGPESTAFGNPHSPHRMGRQAAAAVELARERVAALLPPGGRVIFTGNACEAANLAMRGSAGGRKAGIAYSAIEHAAVRDTAMALGNAVEIPVDGEGLTDPAAELPGDTGLVAVMAVNNEIGTVQPVADWYRRAQESGALFLCDAVQACGKRAIAGADMIAISAHKMHGPKGIGALWVRDGVELDPQVTGGLQEGLRSGTLSPALCAGFGAAAQLATERMAEDAAHIETLWHRARELFADWILNGSAEARWHGNLNIRRDGLDVARLMSECREVMFSAGSACASGSGKPSHVLRAIGLSDAQAKNSIRLGFGRYTTIAEIEEAAGLINAAAEAQGA
ncbi:cysteine desulfurase family protein [Pelagerythrobacter rhizovicinus]|uniref:Cysteine desulfurase n=1 Tax=Pelagerythrobacter rhizovicinus TaxID=2268576 RepID=A0A4Q2KKH8_9SPHN|nr:cysteine desulfurase family protein [Pelagerythrobacter rhizovicinus]RXZ65758.1 cysteine desulfurase [Pelagerythrobacter rhizovicinus]